jgi:hypothetical protein
MAGRRGSVLLWAALTGSAGLVASGVPRPGPPFPLQAPIVRFHHIHYRVGDPAAAMNALARKLEGVRVIVPGLGVGVRAGSEYLLFDRLEESDPVEVSQPPVASAYAAAVEWMAARGLNPAPREAARLRVSAALPEARYDHIAFVVDDLPGAVQALSSAGAEPLRDSGEAVMFETGSGLLELLRDTDRPESFWCPMHPDVRSADEGKCPACGMSLVPIPPPKIGEYKLDVAPMRERGGSGLAGLQLTVREPGTNALVTSFATVHEKLFHLFIVSRDLEYFAHVHPEQTDAGSFVLRHPVPPGEYMLIADFLPSHGTSQMVQKAIIVGGTRAQDASPESSHGLQIRLEARDLAAGKPAELIFTVTDAQTGVPVTDLEPYLGAPAHMLIVRRDLADAVHGHPEETSTGGPTISFHPLLPAAGDYKLWLQVQRAGQVTTTAFALSVPQ